MQEQVTERMLIRGTPEQCFAVLTEFDDYPQWAADIKSVVVEEPDVEGRPSLVTFRAGFRQEHLLHAPLRLLRGAFEAVVEAGARRHNQAARRLVRVAALR